MKQNKKEIKKAKIMSIIALVIFFMSYLLCFFAFDNFEDFIYVMFLVGNFFMINRYVGLALSIYSYVKYKDKFTFIVMMLCICLQVISLIGLLYFAATADFSIPG